LFVGEIPQQTFLGLRELGIGLDDCFVLLSFWRKTNKLDSIPSRMADTYGGAAVAITITSVTNALSFFIGCYSPFLATRIFCFLSGTHITHMYISSQNPNCFLVLIRLLDNGQRQDLVK
jgi:hypothetical protein